ncbi:MAG: alpha/beta hydrolase [Proteobacteria bacterium]|nr:alpha/beta hydrolase [Pseudomonadota bacterium]
MSNTESVIVVHGLWVHGLIMGWLARRIARCGFAARTYSYPSLRLTLTENAERLAHYCAGLAVPRVHIVAHSMGGLVALRMLETDRSVRCGRLVLIGTPYTGSFAAQRLARFPGGQALLGRSIAEWLARPRPVIDGAIEVGVIAGTRGIGLGRLVAPGLPQPNDGVVTLAETMIPGVTQQIALHVGHSEMLVSRAVARQCGAFLRDGRFEPGAGGRS